MNVRPQTGGMLPARGTFCGVRALPFSVHRRWNAEACQPCLARRYPGENMDWDQIETKWAAMALRVRADVQYVPMSLGGRLMRMSSQTVQAVGMADRHSAIVSDARSPIPPK